MVNCSVGEEMEYERDDGNYYNGYWGNSDYQRGHPLSQVDFAESENNYPTIEIELGDIEGCDTDREVDHYLGNRGAAEDYRGVGRK